MSGPTGTQRQWRQAGLAFGLVALATAVLAGAQMSSENLSATARLVTPSASTTSPSSTPSTPSTPPPTTEPSLAPGVRCWTGVEAEVLDDCPEPTGTDGLAWVFPSLDLDTCADLLATESSEQLRQLYECDVTIDGREVVIDYVEWRSEADALDYYDAESPRHVSARGKDGRPLRFGWLDVTSTGEYTGAVAYTDAPFSVFVRAPDATTRSVVGVDVIRMRPTSELRGVPLGR